MQGPKETPHNPVATNGYLVLGMHRSGTSCLTGLLETTGLWLSEVPRHNKNNVKGNLENKTIQAVNAAILAQCGGSWDAPPRTIAWDQIDTGPIRSALAVFSDRPRWLVKDPRMVLTLEAWLPHLSSFQIIGSFRHPASVARSLAARNKFPFDKGLNLWAHYNRRLVELQQRHQFPLVSFDLPPRAYLSQFSDLSSFLSLPFDATAAADFYRPEAVHHAGADESILPSDVVRLYEELMDRRFVSDSVADAPPPKAD